MEYHKIVSNGERNTQTFRITFAGHLAVELMGFEYEGKRYNYSGRKLDNAVKRLTNAAGPLMANAAELDALNRARRSWKK